MISDIAYEQIKDNFWFGSYADCKVVLMKDCGWVNATKMCNEGGKRLSNWTRLEHTQELLKALQHDIEASGQEAVDFKRGKCRNEFILWRSSSSDPSHSIYYM